MPMPIRSRPRSLLHLTVAAFACAGMSVAQAANLGFLQDTPISALTAQDNESLIRAVHDALDQKQDGETANWTTEGQRRGVRVDATITPSDTVKHESETCRATAVVITARGQSMTLHPRFCREGSGKWVFQKKQ